jgi:hypothetical protein
MARPGPARMARLDRTARPGPDRPSSVMARPGPARLAGREGPRITATHGWPCAAAPLLAAGPIQSTASADPLLDCSGGPGCVVVSLSHSHSLAGYLAVSVSMYLPSWQFMLVFLTDILLPGHWFLLLSTVFAAFLAFIVQLLWLRRLRRMSTRANECIMATTSKESQLPYRDQGQRDQSRKGRSLEGLSPRIHDY